MKKKIDYNRTEIASVAGGSVVLTLFLYLAISIL